MPPTTNDLLHGTVDLLILKLLALGPLHGWGISQRIHEISEYLLRVNQGSLYPALHRLEGRGLIDAEWAMSESQRRVRLYRLTRAGKAALALERREWEQYARAVQLVLHAT